MRLNSMQRGFTLIEVVITSAIVVALVTVVAFPFLQFRKQQALQNTTNAVVSILNEARTKTLAAYNDTSYSVRLETSRAILFVGSTYDGSAVTNEYFEFESPIVLQSSSLQGGGTHISFDRLKGTTSQYGTITLAIPSGASKIITVSPTGSILKN
jgi:prepilin-type N-terminal cleavage/methylation domain-containing protein